jgi:hypothetical protein
VKGQPVYRPARASAISQAGEAAGSQGVFHIGLFFADGRDVVQRFSGGFKALCACNDPRRQVRRSKAAAGRRHIAVGVERLVQHFHAGFLHPGFGGQVRTGRHAAEQPKLGQYQRPGALCPDQLA